MALPREPRAFGTCTDSCVKKFGIDESVVKFGVPLGMVMQKPVSAATFLLLAFFFADKYGLSCSTDWIVTAAIVSASVAIAMPPVPGGGAIAYSALLLPLGIPAEALTIALAIDIVIDFLVTAFQMSTLQLTLVNTTARLGLVDREVLRQDE